MMCKLQRLFVVGIFTLNTENSYLFIAVEQPATLICFLPMASFILCSSWETFLCGSPSSRFVTLSNDRLYAWQQARIQRGGGLRRLNPQKSPPTQKFLGIPFCVLQNASKCTISKEKMPKFFWGGGTAPPRPYTHWGGIPPPQTSLPSTPSAPPFECLRHSTPQTTFLDTGLLDSLFMRAVHK